MIRPSRVALVASAAFASAIASGAVAGLLSGLVGVPQLMRFLLIPSIMIMARLAGRWIARRESPPALSELALGGMVYVLVSMADGASGGELGIGLALIGAGGFALMIVYSALTAMRPARLAGAA